MWEEEILLIEAQLRDRFSGFDLSDVDFRNLAVSQFTAECVAEVRGVARDLKVRFGL